MKELASTTTVCLWSSMSVSKKNNRQR